MKWGAITKSGSQTSKEGPIAAPLAKDYSSPKLYGRPAFPLLLRCSAALSALLCLSAAPCQPVSQVAPARAAPVAVPGIFPRVLAAADRAAYAGTRTVEILQGAVRKVHTEYVVHQGQNSRVWFPADSQFFGQVIVETPHERLHYYPKRNVIEVLPPRREDAYERLKQWVQHPGRNMLLSSSRGDSIAGRQTELGIVSDKKGNVRQRLWIDAQTGVLLKREVLDNVGDRSAYFEFTQIDFNPVIHQDDFRINVKGAVRITNIDKVRMLAQKNGLLNIALPSSTGFGLEAVSMFRAAAVPILHEEYKGPRGKLSLFQVAGNVDLQGMRPANQRGVILYGWQMNGHSFALVGNYPADEMRELAQLVGGPRNGP